MKNRNRHTQVIEGPLQFRVCRDCEEPIPETETAFYWETCEDEQFWLGAEKTRGPMCEACWLRRDNLEPPEPDGEAFRGGEAAAYERDEMARVQRELK